MPVQVTSFYEPYFYLGLRDDRYTAEVTQLLQRKFDSVGASLLFVIADGSHVVGTMHVYALPGCACAVDLINPSIIHTNKT